MKPLSRYSSSEESQICWHMLDAGSVWLKEFAFALGTMVLTRNWIPNIRNFGHLENWERVEDVTDPPIKIIRFPLQRGYARFPVNRLFRSECSIVDRLLRGSPRPEESTLICTSPFYAPVAERWPGKIVYYLTDLTKEYAGMNSAQIVCLDQRMCRVAHVVCPNSRRIAEYLCSEAACSPEKVVVIPNATRAQNVLNKPLTLPAKPPTDLADLQRPIIGVIGNLAANMDWMLLQEAVERSRNVSWAFVGPTDMKIPNAAHRKARQNLMQKGGIVRFVGRKHYSQLAHYARAFDVALIPYLRQEPTFSGSATRFYEHLSACRPILASRGHAELLTKEPLLKLVNNAEDLAQQVEDLRTSGFRDGYEELRWKVSRRETWDVRAEALLAAQARIGAGLKDPGKPTALQMDRVTRS